MHSSYRTTSDVDDLLLDKGHGTSFETSPVKQRALVCGGRLVGFVDGCLSDYPVVGNMKINDMMKARSWYDGTQN